MSIQDYNLYYFAPSILILLTQLAMKQINNNYNINMKLHSGSIGDNKTSSTRVDENNSFANPAKVAAIGDYWKTQCVYIM
jgi:hypothetical protein